MKDLQYPLNFVFKITSLSNDFSLFDANGEILCYSRQKILKFKEHVQVYSDETRTKLLYDIKANKWLDFSTTYTFTRPNGEEIGRVARKGWSSLWKANYSIFDQRQNPDLNIREDNGWVKVLDGIFGELPILGAFTGYFFNPSYTLRRPNGDAVVQLSKTASFWGRKFELEKLAEYEEGEEERIILSIMMMILLERRRG